MAVNSITFGGVNSADFGIYISGEGVFNAPKRDVEMVAIPGRNGELALDKGRFENIEVTYPAFNFEPNDYETFAKNLSDFRNAICSLRGYQRLTDTFHPDEYRMATYIGGLEIKPIKYNTASEFSIIFDCKPQRYLTDGETPITLGEWGEVETVSGDIVEIDNLGLEAVKSLSVELEPIQDLHGYDKPWAGGNGKNKLNPTEAFGNYSAYTVNADGSVTVTAGDSRAWGDVAVIPLKAGTYTLSRDIMNGMTAIRTSDDNYASDAKLIWQNQTSNGAFTLASDGGIKVKANYGGTYPVTFKFQLESGSTATSWTPYSNICPIGGRTEVVTSVSGFNVWDEEWEVGGFNTDGSKSSVQDRIRSKNYIPCVGNASYYIKQGALSDTAWSYFVFYDESKSVIGSRVAVYGTFTTPSNARYMKFNANNSYGTTYHDDICINYPSTDHDYHAYNGTTITTALGRTVYGGTLDVVSGELVVDRVFVEISESWNWVRSVSYPGGYYLSVSALNPSGKPQMPFTCSHAKTVTSISDYVIGTCLCDNSINIRIMDTSSTLQDWKDYIVAQRNNGTPIGICYELATPQTYQLTGQDVELIEGTNYVWSDGEITVEHGQNPRYLVNPTRFESSPLLMVEGYGTIGFNGYEIELNNDVFGPVHVSEPVEIPSGSLQINEWIEPDADLVNSGDLIYIDSLQIGMYYVGLRQFSRVKPTVTVTYYDSGTAYEGEYETFTEKLDGANRRRQRSGVILKNIGPLEYDPMAQAEIDLKISIDGEYDNGNTYKAVIELDMTSFDVNVRFNGIVDSETTSLSEYYISKTEISALTADSTKSVLGNPTYIDCDLGEGYRELNGEYISLNRYIDLGSDLPKLAVGANEVTKDDTITELQIVPRWWKI